MQKPGKKQTFFIHGRFSGFAEKGKLTIDCYGVDNGTATFGYFGKNSYFHAAKNINES